MIGMHGTKEAVVSLAGFVKPSAIAEGLGISKGRVSQIFAENPELTALVQPAATPESAQITEIQDRLELKLLQKFEEKIELSAMMMKPLELLKAVSMVNAMKRRAGGPAGFGDALPGTTNTNVVVLSGLPPPRVPSIVMSQRGEIIEAGGRTLVSASKEMVAAALVENLEKVNTHDRRGQIKADSGHIELLADPEAAGTLGS